MNASLILGVLVLFISTFGSALGAAVLPDGCKCEGPTGPCKCDVIDGSDSCMTPCDKPPCKDLVWKDGDCCPSCATQDAVRPEDCKCGDPDFPCKCDIVAKPPACMTACEKPQCENPVPPREGECCPTCPKEEVGLCIHNGNKMKVGEISEGPCEICMCMSGGDVKCKQMTECDRI